MERARNQVFRSLQTFRDQLSQRTVAAFGVPLRTTEAEVEVQVPRDPDIRIGRVFDRSWELLSAVTPMWLFQGIVKRHFTRKIPFLVEKNISRLVSQWEESVRAALLLTQKEAERRLDELVDTVTRLIGMRGDDAVQIRCDLARVARWKSHPNASTGLQDGPGG